MTRLNDLKEVYDTLVAANFDFNNLPADNKYRKYYEWRTQPEKRQLPTESIRERGRRKEIGIISFGAEGDTGKEIVLMGQTTFDTFNSDSTYGAVSVYGIVQRGTTPETNPLADYKRSGLFIPAKVVAAKRIAGGTSRPSNITGRRYTPKTGRSVTIPFGKTVGTDTEFSRQNFLLALLNPNYAVSFKPEKRKRDF